MRGDFAAGDWCPTRDLETAPLTAVDADRLTIRFNEMVDY